MAHFTPAEVFAPGEFIREELEARGWTERDLAEILGRPLAAVSQLIQGRRAVTPRTAKELAAAFGTSAQLWLNLETSWRLSIGVRGQAPFRAGDWLLFASFAKRCLSCSVENIGGQAFLPVIKECRTGMSDLLFRQGDVFDGVLPCRSWRSAATTIAWRTLSSSPAHFSLTGR